MDNKSYCKLMKLMLMFVIALALISAVSAAACRTGVPIYFNIADLNPPNVTLISPPSNYYNDTVNSVTFNCSATDDAGLANISLYITNSNNQSFSLSQTTSVSGTNASASWTLGLANGNYTWNCLAFDLGGNFDWGDQNRSIEINLTIVPPIVPPGPRRKPGKGGMGWDPQYTSAKTIWDKEKPKIPVKPIVEVPRLIANITLEVPGELVELPKEYIVKSKIYYIELIFIILSIILLSAVVLLILYTEIKMKKYRR